MSRSRGFYKDIENPIEYVQEPGVHPHLHRNLVNYPEGRIKLVLSSRCARGSATLADDARRASAVGANATFIDSQASELTDEDDQSRLRQPPPFRRPSRRGR